MKIKNILTTLFLLAVGFTVHASTTITYKTDGLYSEINANNWANTWTSNTTPVVTISCNAGLNAGNGYMAKDKTFTITVEAGYIIKSYTITGGSWNSTTVTPAGSSATTFSVSDNDAKELPVSNINATSTSFSVGGTSNLKVTSIVITVEVNPTISNVYTITNTEENTSSARGSLIYNPAVSTKWVWASGKSGTFNVNQANSQWVFIPTGTAGQYYLYNVGAGKFAIPMKGGTFGDGNSYSWGFSDNAVAVYLTQQANGSFKIKSVTHDVVVSISTGFIGPVINYDDEGAKFYINGVNGADASTAATAAKNKLIVHTVALTAAPASDGWYAIRIQSHTGDASYAGNFLYPLTTEYVSNNYNYPLGHANEVKVQPNINDATYFFKFIKDGQYYHWQLPTGKYALNQSNNFPTSKFVRGGSIAIEYNGAGFFDIKSSSRYVDALADYISCNTTLRTKLDIYPIDLETAGLTLWQVVISGGTEGTKLTCNNANLSGMSSVYNNGYFFFPTEITPSSSDFAFSDNTPGYFEIDDSEKTITALYNPSADGLTASDIVAIQGNQTTGKGNTMQALLRVKLSPTTHATPTSISISLTGKDKLNNVAIYTTTIDELHAASAAPTKVSGDVTPDDNLDIPLTMEQIRGGRSVYLWITGNIKSTAPEWATIDAAITSISYNNIYAAEKTTDLTTVGNPDGVMRIYQQQTALWTPSHADGVYYRIPTMINTADGGIVALTDLRYDHPNDLGKNASNGAGSHKIDVVARRSPDGGLTWQNQTTVAAGDGSTAATYGYGDPAIVRDADGKLHCLMAAGSASYASGMLHMGYSTSTDNGASWTCHGDVYSSIDKGGLTLASAFTTGGKGVTFSNGRMAFAFLGKIGNTTNIYPLFSDDKGSTWHVQPTVAYSGGDESKFEIMNDNSLLVSVRKGSYNGMALRAYNHTTGDASGDGIASWGTAANWGSEMNANGCNADILYYNRSTEDASRPDVIFHTLTKSYSTYRRDLRLYMSFDQGATWKEAFQLQPGYAAYSSMQKLANGDLAIIYEDGSIGNEDKQDCYAINYVVISSELINAKIDELYETFVHPEVTFISQGETNSSAPWCSWIPSSGWATAFTSNSSSGAVGVEVSATYSAFNRQGGYDQRVILFKPSAAGAKNDKFTITAPDGYYITGYTIGGYFGTSSETYTLTADNGTLVDINKNKSQQNPPSYLTISGLKAKQTHITMSNSNSTNGSAAYITHFVVNLSKELPVTLNAVGDANYATLYLPFDVTTDANTKAYYISSVSGGYAQLTEVTNREIAANTAVVLINESSNSATFDVTSGLSQQISENANMLKGTLTSMTLDLSDETPNYSLGRKDGKIGFYKFDSNGTYTITLGANKAYLETTAAVTNVKGFLFDLDDIATDIDGLKDNVECSMFNVQSSKIYNLAGQRLNKPMKGINIINGKKVLVK